MRVEYILLFTSLILMVICGAFMVTTGNEFVTELNRYILYHSP